MGEIIRHVLAVLPAFLLACLAVAALPGPSTALFLHRTVRDGRAPGWPPRPAEPPGAGSAGRGWLSQESGGRRG